MSEEKSVSPARPRTSRSLFAPIVLIAAGVFFLLDNLGITSGLDWNTALAYWPLALIFIGLNVLVTQLRPPLGTLLSGLLALLAVVVFGFVLLRGTPAGGPLRGLALPAPRELREESFSMTRGTAETAAVTLNLGNLPADVAANDGQNLVAGTIWTRTGVEMTPRSEDDSHVEVEIGETRGGLTLDPREWTATGQRWQISLAPDLPIDLTVDASNGPVTADLAGLMLSNLDIDAGNGRVTATLPDGVYDLRLEGGNGHITLTLPAMGSRTVRVDGGNGGVTLTLPVGVAARVEYDEGNGSVSVDGRFTRVSGDGDEGVYETADYATADERVLFIVDSGNGSVRIGE